MSRREIHAGNGRTRTLCASLLVLVLVVGPSSASAVGDKTIRFESGQALFQQPGDGPTDAVPVDLDGDGDKDLIVMNTYGRELLWYKNVGGVFTKMPIDFVSPEFLHAIEVDDFDLDGKPDIVLASDDNKISVYFGATGGGIDVLKTLKTITLPGIAMDIVAGQVAGSLHPELLAVVPSTGEAYLYTNDGTGGFGSSATATLTAGAQALAACFADYDGDADLDIAVTASGANRFRRFRNDGGGSFALEDAAGIVTGGTPHHIAAAHLGGDNKIDFVVANLGTDNISVYISGSGSYARTDYAVGDGPHAIAIHTYDPDIAQDIAVANREGDTVTVLRNDGSGGFAVADTFATGEYPDSLAVLRTGSDLKNDLVVACLGSDVARIHTNTSLPTTYRLAGASRYDTAVKLSGSAYPPGTSWVVIATGRSFPDALAGAPLAHALGAPILLTAPDGLSAEVKAEVTRLGATSAIVLGGEKAVSDNVIDDLVALGIARGNIERVSGITRFATSAQIAARLQETDPGTPIDRVYVATGRNFPDALAVGAIAARDFAPILLVEKDTVPGEIQAALAFLPGVTDSVIVGGDGAVSDAVKDAFPSPQRLSGNSRYETAADIVRFGLANGFAGETIYLATARKFPDALAAGPVAAQYSYPLVLTDSSTLPAATASLIRELATENRRVFIIGGTGAVSDSVVDAAKQAF